jgi:hypothetical protein
MASRQADWAQTSQAQPLEGLAAAEWRSGADRKLSASLAPLVSAVQRERPLNRENPAATVLWVAVHGATRSGRRRRRSG